VTFQGEQHERLVVVSNRGPYRLRETARGLKYERSVGGLASAVLPVLERWGGVWIAAGRPGGRHPSDRSRPSFDLRYVELPEDKEAGYYSGMSNDALWPLCHYFLGRVRYERKYWEAYEWVNRRFAEVIVEEAGEDDIIWIHDYHLARVPHYLRQLRPTARIAFFWHIPFPAPELFRTLPWRRQFLESLLLTDVLGFHIPEYVKNFGGATSEVLGTPLNGETIEQAGHTTQVIARPIAIDYDAIEREAKSERVVKRANHLRETLRGQVITLGVERLDYTKGIAERLRGMERLLESNYELRGKVTLIQIVTPSREEGVEAYREKKREIDEIVGRVNGKFSNDLWVPIHYLYRTFSASRLVVYYRAADVALVTPLRDGLNLVAKEYVASRVDQDGVLILSEFAGVSGQLPEALLVNPYSDEDMATGIERALRMSKEEQRRRMQPMQSRLKEEGISWWTQEFLDRMAAVNYRRERLPV
jgi:trehalose 6-phosphate synthase